MGRGASSAGSRERGPVEAARRLGVEIVERKPDLHEDEARALAGRFGFDPRLIGVNYRGFEVVTALGEVEQEAGAQVGDLCVYTKDAAYEDDDAGARAFPNFRGAADDDEGDYRYYYFAPLAKEAPAASFRPIEGSTVLRQPPTREASALAVIREGRCHLWLQGTHHRTVITPEGTTSTVQSYRDAHVLESVPAALSVEEDVYEEFAVCQRGKATCEASACPFYARPPCVGAGLDDEAATAPERCVHLQHRTRAYRARVPLALSLRTIEWHDPPADAPTYRGYDPEARGCRDLPLLEPILTMPEGLAHLAPHRLRADAMKTYLNQRLGIHFFAETESHYTYKRDGSVKKRWEVPTGRHYIYAKLRLTTAAGPARADVRIYCEPPESAAFPDLAAGVKRVGESLHHYRSLLSQAADVTDISLVTTDDKSDTAPS